MNKNVIYLVFAIVLTISTISSCTDSDLCYDIEHPHTGNVKFAFNWSKEYAAHEGHPDSMLIIADRVINAWKCAVEVHSEDGSGIYIYNAPVSEKEDEGNNESEGEGGDSSNDTGSTEGGNGSTDGEDEAGSSDGNSEGTKSGTENGTEGSEAENTKQEEKEDHEEFKLRTGQYKLLAFNMGNSEFDYSDVYRYLDDKKNQVKLQDIYISYKSYLKNDPALRKPTEHWIDYNPYAEYIHADMLPVFYDSIESLEITTNSHVVCKFTPKPLTQNINIVFRINKEGTINFVIDSVVAEVSGIPHKINLANGYVDITKTHKMMFKMRMEDGNGRAVTKDDTRNRTIVCKKSIDVTALIGSESTTMSVGPGIMQVMVFATAIDNTGGSEIKLAKKIQGKINLCNTINNAGLIEYTDDGLHARRAKMKGTLNIVDAVRIDGRTIVETEGDNSIDRWKNCTGIIVDI